MSNKFVIINIDALDHLTKLANKLDSLELWEEASVIDDYLSKCAIGHPATEELPKQEDPLTQLVTLANELDCSGEEQLQKYASVLDEILLTIGAPKNAVAEEAAKTEAEIERLREKYREQSREDLYHKRTYDELDGKQNKQGETEKAYNAQVKTFRTLEAPLSTRYCPDHPGAPVTRIADHVYQCEMDKKIYNYESGFRTMKGNEVPGGAVERQTKDWGNRDVGHTMFDTRQSLMSRFSSAESDPMVKFAADLSKDESTLDTLVRLAAEAMDLSNAKAARATENVRSVAREFDDAVLATLEDLTQQLPPKDNQSALDIYSAEAPFQVLMTLRGEGSGIWDGSWDHLYDSKQLQRGGKVYEFLKHKLGSYADDTGGGKFNEALMNAAMETTGNDNDLLRLRWPKPISGESFEDELNTTAQALNQSQSQVHAPKDYEYGMTMLNGRKTLEVRVKPGTPELRKQQITTEIQSSFGTLYPIVFKEVS